MANKLKKLARSIVEELVDCGAADYEPVQQYLAWTENKLRPFLAELEVSQRALKTVTELWNEQRQRIAELEASVIAPGVMRCAKCEFVLTKNSINMSAGTITAGDSKTEPCPNGCGPLWPVTWREQAIQSRDDSDQWFEELQAAKQRVVELEAIATNYAGKFQKAQDAVKHLIVMNDSDKAEIAHLKELLATPVRLPPLMDRELSGKDSATTNTHNNAITACSVAIRGAGFKSEATTFKSPSMLNGVLIDEVTKQAPPAMSDGSVTISKAGMELLTQAIGGHGAIVQYITLGRNDLALAEARKWVEAIAKAAMPGSSIEGPCGV